ncbi:superoxide dismutase [Cu-Zn] SodC [Vineibacter terrae]|uniref:superoxide dismutase [Cu-Zn] SodC n=1 Tax=Vineibacter terrae TaxID=2586908 RepID=UPI002E358B51|nr:superoxide dismutase [Cu-Zn] SodC [Vineibacter terrae]HEX2890965.1 superoxide dismutase [Cu-Zn] SodC [Vineibacter terrae]
MRKTLMCMTAMALCVAAATAVAQTRTTVTLNLINDKGPGAAIGSVVFIDTPKGLAIEPNLTGLPPGSHGFHVHEKPNCGPAEQDGKMVPGLAAGGHYDPKGSKAHRGPEHEGHLGDLPLLVVEKDGVSTAKMLAPRLKVADLRGRSLMVHAGGDNYADQPQPLGGGGGRIACGVFDIKMAN